MKTIILAFTLVAGLYGNADAPKQHHEYSRDHLGIVTDITTGLQWQDSYAESNDSIKNTTWDDAQRYCSLLNLGGYDDWRTPTVEELTDITDHGNTDPAINSVFQHTVSSAYWSSLESDSNQSVAWFVYFYNGFANWKAKDGNAYVRCIRLR
ncbi:MAG: DUF1566 domain-containing protein [Sulfurimonas sp.]|nr:MAG: DUF1566 domain-containing protein [Sulfurimonas sp.]